MIKRSLLLIILFTTNIYSTDFRVFLRYDYYTTETSAEIIVKNNTDENEIVKIITPHDTLFTTSEKNNITHFQIDISQLEKTLNAINVNIGETYSKELLLKKIPPQKNEIKIDKLTGAMIKSQKPFIPFGFYCYFPVQETLLEQEAVNGFNMVSPYQNVAKDDFKDRLSYMDRAAELDMVVNYNLLSVSGGGGVNSFIFEDTSQSELEKKLIEEINKIKHHPALLSWYISDEPVANHKSPQELEAIYDIIKREDPYHPISIVFWHSKKSKKYAKAMDIAMADPYPIPKQSMRKVAGVTQMLKSNFEFDKPIWMVPQSFGGNEWWDREPTSQELRLMTYFSILNGATGIKYFVRNGANGFPKSVKTWNEAGEIALEISEITPYLLSENKIIVDNEDIIAKHYQDNNRHLLIVANKQNKPLNFEIEIDPLLYNKKLYVINQNRTIKADNTLSDILSNYAVNLYEFAEFTNYSIHKDNLIKDPGFENSVSVGVPNHCYAYAGSDKGSTYFVDSKEYYEGHHSLKIVTPTYYKGPRLNFHRINLKADQTYNVSVVAKGVPFIVNDEIEAPKFWEFWKWFKKDDEVTPKFTFNLKLSKYESRYFELTNEWKEYEFTIHTKKELKYLKKINTYLELIGKGKAWFDNLQVYKMQSETDTKN